MFNAHHSPVGAFSSFTLGHAGPKGGLGLELGGPADESVYIGLERHDGKGYDALPFFAGSADAAVRYDVSAEGEAVNEGLVSHFPAETIRRDFNIGSDSWEAGDLKFTLYSSPKSVPEPSIGARREPRAKAEAMKAALVPAVFAELTIDNRKGKRPRKAFFGYEGRNPYYCTRTLDPVSKGRYVGVGQGIMTAIVSNTPGVTSGIGFTLDQVLHPDHPANPVNSLGGVGLLQVTVPAGKRQTIRFAICFHRGGIVTAGLSMRYYYNRYFKTIEEVAEYALTHWEEQKKLSLAADRRLSKARLNEAQKFQVAHAARSYFGSTEFLETEEGTPFWAVNEGEYRMLNTFDLTVDHLFFEMEQNPWVVRNQLDWFVKRYSYTDKVRLPGDTKEYPGGISFTHDMGVGNCVSRPGYSSYERHGLHGCFSYMTHEQLVNWVCCATTYVFQTRDAAWLKQNLSIFKRCFTSLLNRDHPDPKQRDGVMSADSSRCMGGAEITTYDSLDVSLGQARNNLYLAVKAWAAYLGLKAVFAHEKLDKLATQAETQSKRAASTIASHLTPEGYIPAVMGEGNQSRIIPAIEGLVFPLEWGMKEALSMKGPYSELLKALKTHLATILVPGVCRFDDGGWKLSSTNDNSWLSKIYLCQHVARNVFGIGEDAAADRAHKDWLLRPDNAYFCWSDQMVAGIAKGSKYYPRGVTNWLWIK